MKIIEDLQKEIARLFCIGSMAAKGDFNLKFYIDSFELLGQKETFFLEIAKAIKGIYHADNNSRFAALMHLGGIMQTIYISNINSEDPKTFMKQTPFLEIDEVHTGAHFSEFKFFQSFIPLPTSWIFYCSLSRYKNDFRIFFLKHDFYLNRKWYMKFFRYTPSFGPNAIAYLKYKFTLKETQVNQRILNILVYCQSDIEDLAMLIQDKNLPKLKKIISPYLSKKNKNL
ncbi:MAG: hypothetical protein MUE53_08625 [Chitinophagales bacterium]|jgi:hypothetical protein|nr:hypothetical protein [Chitinophagales bacterium]